MKQVNSFFKSEFSIIALILYTIILLYPSLITRFRVFTGGDLMILIFISVITIIFTCYGFFKISKKNQNILTTKQIIGIIFLLLVFTIIWIILAHVILMLVNPL